VSGSRCWMQQIPFETPPSPKRLRIEEEKEMAGETPGAGTPSAGGQRGIREGTLMWPMLTRTNYSEWAMLMQCNFEALEVWEAIVPGKNVSRSTDRQAMSALMHSVPSDVGSAGCEVICQGGVGSDQNPEARHKSCQGSQCPETYEGVRESCIQGR